MREPPADLANDAISACLCDRYGLAVRELTFLPLGHDSSAWVYRARAAGEASYFLKARLAAVNEASLLVPRYLHDHGVARAVAPLPTARGTLWAEVGGYALILYPFVAGATGLERGMTARQWTDYGALLRQVHDTAVSPELARVMRREPFAPEWAGAARRVDAHIGARTFADPAEDLLARFWQARRAEIRRLLRRADDLGQRLALLAPPLVLCHADIHTANVLVDDGGQIWFVDWDETILAPRERDLMFAVGGLSSDLVRPEDEELFLRGYGPVAIDPLALAYYRYAWAVGDIGSYGEQVFLRPDLGPLSKREGVDRFMSLFEPGAIVALAFASHYGEE